MQLFGVKLGTVLGCGMYLALQCAPSMDMLSHICVPNQNVRNLEEQWLKPFGMLGIVTCVV